LLTEGDAEMSDTESKAQPTAPATVNAAAPEPSKATASPTRPAEAQPSLLAEPQTITFTDNDRHMVIPTLPTRAKG
jgi:hypothetical protein